MTDDKPEDETEDTPTGKRKPGKRPPFLVLLMLILLCTVSGFMMVIAAVFWVLAVLVLTANLKGRRKAELAQGEIIGIRVRRSKRDRHIHYHPVYRYTLPSTGAGYETTSNAQHNLPTGLETGTRMPLLVKAETPLIVRPYQLRYLVLATMLFLVPGTWLFLLAAQGMSPLMLSLSLGIIAAWTVVHMIPFMMSEETARKQAVDEAQEVAELNTLPLKDIRDVMASKSGRSRLGELKGSGIAFLVIAVLLLAGSVWLTSGLAELKTQGARAEGTVTATSCETSKSGTMSHRRSSTICHATFEFKDAAGAVLTFKPGTASSFDNYEQGQKVTVLYLPADPVGSAMVDKGMNNIQWPLFLFLVSAICFYRAGRNLCACWRFRRVSASTM